MAAAGKNLGKLVLCGLIGGLLVAAAAYPGLFTAGRAADDASNAFLALPSELRAPPTAQTSYVYAADGKTLLTSFYDENRHDVPLSQISLPMQQAIVAAEDTRFFQHGAVDVKAIARALVANGEQGAVAQGASTLTMQYVRNVLKTDPNATVAERAAAVADTSGRKVKEIRYAVTLEQNLSKEEILDRYLNIAYFGDGAYGVFAAAQTYFSELPSQLTIPQAAMIAGIVQSPDVDNPVGGDQSAARSRRAYVLHALAGMKVITAAEATAQAKTPLGLHAQKPPNDCTAVPKATNSWGFFCDYFTQWWDRQAAFGVTVADRQEALRDGGYHIVTSMDPTIQAAATKQSLSVYGYGNRKALPIAVVQPGSGRVLALSVNRHYSLAANPHGQHSYPNTVNQLIAGGGAIAGYQTGSTFKLFTMLAALEAGKSLDTSFVAPSPLVTIWPANGSSSCHGGHWCPTNATPKYMDGKRTMWTGYGRSVNTYWVWMEEQIGPQNAVAMAKRLGIVFRAKSDATMAATRAKTWGSFTLGVMSTTPLDLVNAYATVAAGGIYCAPLPVLSIKAPGGAALSVADPQCHRVISADIAAAAADAARCPVAEQGYYGQCDGGTAPVVPSILGSRPVAGKTGSSELNATESFVGFTPQVAAAGTAADPADPRDRVGSAVEHDVTVAVAKTLAVALKGKPFVKFPVPSRTIAFGRKVTPTTSPGPRKTKTGGPPGHSKPTSGPKPPRDPGPPGGTGPTAPPTKAPPPPTDPPPSDPPTQDPDPPDPTGSG